MQEEVVYEILSVVEEIPLGRVASYGQIARVVNHAGRLAPGWTEQRALLEREGVAFLPNGYVDMKHCQWEC